MCIFYDMRQVRSENFKSKYHHFFYLNKSQPKVISQYDNYSDIYTYDTDNYKLQIWIKEQPSLPDQSSLVPYLHRKLKHKQINSVPIMHSF